MQNTTTTVPKVEDMKTKTEKSFDFAHLKRMHSEIFRGSLNSVNLVLAFVYVTLFVGMVTAIVSLLTYTFFYIIIPKIPLAFLNFIGLACLMFIVVLWLKDAYSVIKRAYMVTKK